MNKYKSILLACTVLLNGCDLSPELETPQFNLPEQYKEATPAEQVDPSLWAEVVPAETVTRGEWWSVFGDEMLNQLQRDAASANPTLAIAAERVTQARAASGVALAELFPDIDVGFSPKREKFSAGSPNLAPGQVTKPQTSYRAQGILTYELDLFGRLTGAHKIAELNAEATEAMYQSTLLSMQADVAQLYFTLRSLDAERDFQHRVLTTREESLRVARSQYDLGEISDLELAQAEAELAATKSETAALDRNRVELENAMAILLGKIPSSYHFPNFPLAEKDPPAIPPGIPSTLIARRPDISAAIRQMEAANRRIGVARTAFLPSIALTAVGGFESRTLKDVFKWSNRTWAIGPGLGSVITQPIFEGGQVFYEIERIASEKEEAVTLYKQQVMTAFKEVEDSLAAIRLLAEEYQQQNIASAAALRASNLARHRYDAGDISFVDSLTIERSALATRRAAIRSHGMRYVATISLIRALGGGWDVPAMPVAAEAALPPQPVTTETVTPLQPTENPVVTPDAIKPLIEETPDATHAP